MKRKPSDQANLAAKGKPKAAKVHACDVLPFMQLPGELREMVYSIALNRPSCIFTQQDDQNVEIRREGTAPSMQLIIASRTLHTEAITALYDTTVEFEETMEAQAMLHVLEDFGRHGRYVKKLTLALPPMPPIFFWSWDLRAIKKTVHHLTHQMNLQKLSCPQLDLHERPADRITCMCGNRPMDVFNAAHYAAKSEVMQEFWWKAARWMHEIVLKYCFLDFEVEKRLAKARRVKKTRPRRQQSALQ